MTILKKKSDYTRHNITADGNGYPTRQIGVGYTGFDTFAEAEAFANKHGGTTATFMWRNGWGSTAYLQSDDTTEPMNITAEDYGDDYEIAYSFEELLDLETMAFDAVITDDDALQDEIDDALKAKQRIIDLLTRKYKSFDFNHKKLVLMLNSREDDKVFEELDDTTMEWYDEGNSQTYAVGVFIKRDK